jgi:ABC-2 type transport system ATP-binding protein
MECAIEVENLTKSFDGFQALRGISFKIERGDVVGYLGPNGAGKTTTIKILTNLLKPSSGHARICQLDVSRHPKEALQHVGCLIEVPGIYDYLTPHELLTHFGRVRGMSKSDIAERIDEVLRLTRISDWEHEKIGAFSTGMLRRLMIAQTILHEPEILILDEPAIGLDPKGIREVRELIRKFQREEMTVLMSSHLLPEVSETCNSVIFLNEGRIVAQDTVENLQRKAEIKRIEARFLNPLSAEETERMGRIEMVEKVNVDGDVACIDFDGKRETASRILEELVRSGFQVVSYSPGTASLEEFYVSIMGDERGVGQ